MVFTITREVEYFKRIKEKKKKHPKFKQRNRWLSTAKDNNEKQNWLGEWHMPVIPAIQEAKAEQKVQGQQAT